LAELDRLAKDVDQAVPVLAKARQAAESARSALTALDGELAKLGAVAAPPDAAAPAGAAASARTARDDAAARGPPAERAGEEREEKLRDELANAGDATELRRLLDAHAERRKLSAESAEIGDMVAAATAEHDASVADLVAATKAVDDATSRVAAAEEEVEA